VISASNDLHGNLSRQAVAEYDAVTAYRTVPHTDVAETRRRAFEILVEMIRSGRRLHKAHVAVPLTLPGERAMTTVEPGRSVYARLDEITRRDGVVDASVLAGYVWADEPRNHASVVVLGTDRDAVNRGAREISRHLWSVRHDLRFGMPTGSVDECILAARASSAAPFFISDAGDNLTGGGGGDIPYVLERLLAHEVEDALVAAVTDERAVQQCFAAGVGSSVSLRVGGRLDPVHGTPLPVAGEVVSLHDHLPGNRISVVAVGGVRLVLTEHRVAFTKLSDFEALGLDLSKERIVVVKLGYLFPELAAVAAMSYLAFSPGAIDPHVESLAFSRIVRPMYPFDPELDWQPPESCIVDRQTTTVGK
jgi:microcystin degradation protein MlrC